VPRYFLAFGKMRLGFERTTKGKTLAHGFSTGAAGVYPNFQTSGAARIRIQKTINKELLCPVNYSVVA
jgi:hypothetical protein